MILTDIIWLVVGLVLILVGANMLTDGSASAARRWGMSDLVVGLTVVAFGTSAPELVISLMSAIEGKAGLAIGNVVGSNIFNVCVIAGITAMVRPIKVERNVLTADMPMVVLSSLVLLVMGNSVILNGSHANILERTDGIILLFFFIIFMRHTFAAAREAEIQPDMAAAALSSGENVSAEKEMPLWRALLWISLGLGGLIFGGDRFVSGASGVASAMGVSDAVIGLTIVAAGTSLPELATSVTAALKGKPGIALGNVIGSNIFNIFLVLGCAATASPLPLGTVGNVDLLVLAGSSLLFWIFGWFFGNRTITRAEGLLLLLCYGGYMAWLLSNA